MNVIICSLQIGMKKILENWISMMCLISFVGKTICTMLIYLQETGWEHVRYI